LQPARAPEPKQLQAWIAQLDSDSFKERETAQQELQRRGAQALPAMHAALANPASREQQRWLETLIMSLEDPYAGEAPGHTMNNTALVHEAYLRRVGNHLFDDRGRFFAAA
jgi:hypothetical protein